MANLFETVANEIIDAIKKDAIVLPTLPEVSIRVRDLAQQEETSLNDLTKVVAQDAALSARIIQIANSPLLRARNNATDITSAVCQLGIKFTSNLALGLAMDQMFQATSDIVDKRMRAVWSQSTEVASICHVLASHFTTLTPDKAMLGGLIHKIGVLPILTYAEDHPNLLSDSLTLDKLIEKLHPILGGRILKTWDFPKELTIIPTHYLKFEKEADEVDYADLVTVAMLQSVAGTDHPYTKLDWHKIGAFERIGLEPDMDVSEAADVDTDDIKNLID